MELIEFNKLINKLDIGKYANKVNDKLIEIEVKPINSDKRIIIKVNGEELYDVTIHFTIPNNTFIYDIIFNRDNYKINFNVDNEQEKSMVSMWGNFDEQFYANNHQIRYKKINYSITKNLIWRKIDDNIILSFDLENNVIFVYLRKNNNKGSIFESNNFIKVKYDLNLKDNIIKILDRFQSLQENMIEEYKDNDLSQIIKIIKLPYIKFDITEEMVEDLKKVKFIYDFYNSKKDLIDSDNNLKDIIQSIKDMLLTTENAQLEAFKLYVSNHDITDPEVLYTINEWFKILNKNKNIKKLRKEI